MPGKAVIVRPEDGVEVLTRTVESSYQDILRADETPVIDENGRLVPVAVEMAVELVKTLDKSSDRHFVYMGAACAFATTGKRGRARTTLKEFAENTGVGRVAMGQYRKIIRICGKPAFQKAFMEDDTIDPVSGKDFCLMLLDAMPTIRFVHLRAMSDLQFSLDVMAARLKEWARDGVSSSAAEVAVKAENGGPINGKAYYRGHAKVFALQLIPHNNTKIARVTIDLDTEDDEPNFLMDALREAKGRGKPLWVDCALRMTKEKE